MQKKLVKLILSLFILYLSLPQALISNTAKHNLNAGSKVSLVNPIPPRLQWNANFGYCGEVSFISAGLYYGQYLSQYTARSIASNSTPQNKPASQLLLGVNDTYAAEQMHLNAIAWGGGSQTSTHEFLVWIKNHVAQKQPVIIGVYTNEYLFYNNTNKNGGDPDYDHIVPVIAVSSSHSLPNKNYYRNDIITFSDNGLWNPTGTPTYLFSYPFSSFQATRAQANNPNGSVYSLPDHVGNYGIAITGVIDLYGNTLPVRLTTNINNELPSIKNGTNTAPSPEEIILTITVSGLEPGVNYYLYRYNDMAKVPNSHFNAQASNASYQLPFSIETGHTFVISEHILSNEVAAYRAVKATAP